MPLTTADLRGAGGALPPVISTVLTPQDQDERAKEIRAKQVEAAAALPESAATKAMLGMIGEEQGKANDYRVAIGNALEAVAQLETHLLAMRQRMLATSMTEQDGSMRTRIESMLPVINGVLMRFEQIHRDLAAVEVGLTQLGTMGTDALDWAKQTDYLPADAPA